MSRLFFSYSHKDESLRDRLEVHLATLKREGAIEPWHDRRIDAGDEFDHRIDENLERADVILLLVSPDFLNSEYCQDVELRRALERHDAGTARVIPVILKPCDWKHTQFSRLLAVPTDGVPITRWPDEDEAFLNVVEQIRKALPAGNPLRSTRTRLPEKSVKVEALGPRSSNMRLRKTFSDADRDRFLDETFEYMGRFFENSLRELGGRNDGIEGRFKQLDATHFKATIYEHGKTRSECVVGLGGGFGAGITYLQGKQGHGNGFNEMLSVESDDQHLYLKMLGMSSMGTGREARLSFEGAAEHYWSMLIQPLQQ